MWTIGVSGPGDFELLTKYYDFQGEMLKFQYGAFNPADIELVKKGRTTSGFFFYRYPLESQRITKW